MGPGHVYIGTETVTGAFMQGLQVGMDPNYYVHRAPNLDLKLSLLSIGPWALAFRQSAILLFKNAQDRMFVETYSSRFVNRRSEILVLPSALSGTWDATSFLSLHVSLVLLSEFSLGKERLRRHVWGGASAMLELTFLPGNSLVLHTGEAGGWYHDFWYLGASYRFNYAWFIAHLGYAYRIYGDGVQASPMLSLGAAL